MKFQNNLKEQINYIYKDDLKNVIDLKIIIDNR